MLVIQYPTVLNRLLQFNPLVRHLLFTQLALKYVPTVPKGNVEFVYNENYAKLDHI